MIDFNKPLRVVDNPMSVIREPDGVTRLMSMDGILCVINWRGEVWRLESMNVLVENVPEKKVRYQMQYENDSCGNWNDDKVLPEVGRGFVKAWLIETDHGEGADPRWTYERIEVK